MSRPKEVLLIGAGGHARAVLDCLSADEFKVTGIVDRPERVGESFEGIPIVGCDDDLPSLREKFNTAIIGIGMAIGVRKKIFYLLEQLNYELPTIVSPLAYVSKTATLGKGTVIMHHALVNAGADILENCLVNTKALVEHDTNIGSHTFISTGATINGHSYIGNACLIGSGAVVNHSLNLSDNIVIGSGAVVTEHLSEQGTYKGTPARLSR